MNNVYSNYEWSTGESTSSIIVSSPGSYQITVTDQNGCLGFDSVTVLQVANPVLSITAASSTIFCQGDSVLLAASPALASYQWYRRNYAIPGATSMNYVAKNSGGYKCIAQNASLCSDTSNIIIVHVPCIPIGPNHDRNILNSEFESPPLQIFPNLGSGLFTVESASGQLQVFNSIGSLILSVALFDGVNTLIFLSFQMEFILLLSKLEIVNSQKVIMKR
ncbi:MAG: immunoglobulin domain-containing protein [Bacteroidetes bacterium]|nr:immunoglobulin domain-containing protein [Bacteroidota bacterium]